MIVAYATLEVGQTKSNCYAYHKYTQSCHKAGRLKGYSLITLKKSRPMAQDIMASIQKTYKVERKSYR
jgi:hypothetical protein